MRVLIDTSVWSLFLRRRRTALQPSEAQRRILLTMRELIRDGRGLLIGVVRQELLSGLHDPGRFDHLANYLRFFDDEKPDVEDYEHAARFDNECRHAGIATSVVDMLLCAMADRRELTILTTDQDFQSYAKAIRVRLYQS